MNSLRVGQRRSLWGRVTGLFLAASSLAASAQVLAPPQVEQLEPLWHGQWAGPYELGSSITDDGNPSTPPFETAEIAHAIVLPPPPGQLSLERVILVPKPGIVGGDCIGCAGIDLTNQKFGRGYVWKPTRPETATLIPIHPSYPQTGEQDLFCGGHCFLKDGSLLWAGGTDWLAECQQVCSPCCRGHEHAWLLDQLTDPPTWIPASSASNMMSAERWYPRAIQLGDNTVLVGGHTGDPPGAQELTRDVYVPLAGWASPAANPQYFTNYKAELCGLTQGHPLLGYPRLNLLSNATLFHSDAASDNFPPANEMSRFLDVQFKPGWSCADGIPRWRGGTGTLSGSGTTPWSLHIDGSAVRLVTWNSGTSQFTEVVYSIGGSIKEVADADGHCAVGSPSDYVKSAEKMTNPDFNASWVDVGVADLFQTSVNHNTVILLDGSIFKVGGAAVVESGGSTECAYRKWPVRYIPPEVVETTGFPTNWEWCARQVAARQYHSVAGLLRDGRVFSAGGANADSDAPYHELSDHSVEIYSPPYFFSGLPRPVIDVATLKDPYDPVTPTYQYGSSMTFQVTTGSAMVERVAIIRNGNVTHAFDAGQAYVELARSATPTLVGPGKWQVSYFMPVNGNWAPPGFYYLTVVDTNEMPSHAEWIRVGPP